MISTFVLLTIVGGVCRLGLNWVLRRKLGVSNSCTIRPTKEITKA
jgi:hypothetical protein